MWKDFFYFSKGERQGIIVLVALIAIVILVGQGMSIYRKQQDSVRLVNQDEEYNRFIDSLKEQDSISAKRRHIARDKANSNTPQHTVVLRSFDPNTTDSITFLELGLPPWMTRNILRYRAKGGQFRTPEDFRKIYGLTNEQFTSLLPYIYIGEQFQRKDTQRLAREEVAPTVADTLHNRTYKYPLGTIIGLNTADTTELKKIPGIGSGIAKRIVNYRQRLGGYYHTSQLQEIKLNPDIFSSWFRMEAGETSLINLNKASLERLTSHPYFNFYQAKTIVEHRKRKGDLKQLEQLALYEEFTSQDLERMQHYVCFN